MNMPSRIQPSDDRGVPSFVYKLSAMLQDFLAAPYIAWSKSGQSIVIENPELFSVNVLPRYRDVFHRKKQKQFFYTFFSTLTIHADDLIDDLIVIFAFFFGIY
jgi:hypothetical protein